MPQEQPNKSQSSEEELRPVILADAATLRDRDTYLRHCFVGLADESGKATLLCPADAELGQVAAAPVDVVQYPPLMSFGLWQPILSPLIGKLRRTEPTILHCLSESKLKLTLRLSRLLDVPFIVSMNSAPKRSWKRFCTGKFSGIVTPSQVMAGRMRKDVGAEADMVRCIKVGTFVSDRTACFAGTNRLVTLVIVHPLESCGDFEPVFSAIKHLSIDGVEMVVALMGSGKADHKVRRLIADLGLGNVINIVPEVRPLRQVFSGADVFIKPRRSTGFDFAMLDAMSEGMAVAACRGDDEDILREGETSAMFEEGDHVSIYTTLGTLLRERDYARHLAVAGQEMLRAEYRVSGMVADTIAAYRWAMDRWRK